MPVVLPLVALEVLVAAVGLTILALLLAPVIERLLQSIAESVPLIGGKIADALGHVVSAIVDPLIGQARESSRAISATLVSLGHAGIVIGQSTMAIARASANTLEWLLETELPRSIRAAVLPVQKLVHETRVAVARVESSVRRLGDELDTRIRALRRYVESSVYVPLARRIGRVEHDLDVALDRVTRYIRRPLERVIEVELPLIRARIGRIERLTRGLTREHVGALVVAGASTLVLAKTLAIPQARFVRRCRPKLDPLCRADTEAWEDLLADLVALSSAFSVLELARQAQVFAQRVLPLLEEAIEEYGASS